MELRKLGSIEVSPVGMGCMGFSHGYGAVPEESYAIEAIREAHEAGCTLFDTAESYGREMFWEGHNEQLVGRALEPIRGEVVIATKFHLHAGEAEGSSVRAAVRRHLEQSLRNLRTDHVELYYLHRLSPSYDLAEIAEAVAALIDDGLVGGWGLSQVGVGPIETAQAVCPLSAVQNLYNMLERDCEAEVIPYCKEHGIGVVPFSPTSSGLLSGKVTAQTKFEGDDVRKFVPQLSPENITANQPLIDKLTEYAEAKGATAAQVSLAWMLRKWPNVVPIPGSRNKGRIIENLTSWDVTFTDEEFAELEAVLNGTEVYGHRGHEEDENTTFSNNWR